MKVRAGHALSGDHRYNEMLPEEVWMRRSGRNVQGDVGKVCGDWRPAELRPRMEQKHGLLYERIFSQPTKSY